MALKVIIKDSTKDKSMSKRVTSGINPQVKLFHFSDDERAIINRLSREWYVTHGGEELQLGPISVYRYILMKPTDMYQEMFNLEREIVVIFSHYENFEPRTLDAIPIATKRHQQLRIERVCSVVISQDDEIENRLRDLLKNDQEAQIVVPFSYSELLQKNNDTFYIRNRFRSHFYSRDLFAVQAPLKKDLYFFGRNDLVHALVNRHRSNEVSGLFGLRKTGKTSVIFGVQRALRRVDGNSVFVDCQNPAFHGGRWNSALFYILREAKNQLNLKINLRPDHEFTETKAPILFEETLLKINREIGFKNLLVIFDEVENITFGVSPSPHWKEGMDFVYFWQTLRSLFQKLPKIFSYLIVGTNPLCIEIETILGNDNPLFSQVPLQYVPRFDVPQTREMIRKLGKIMGIQFDEIIYGKLTEDFGGHPFLIRHVCSVVNNIGPKERPTRVDKTLYESAKKIFLRDYSHYMDMILNVLKGFFPDEYDMLTFLAHGDEDTFQEFARHSPLYTNHLIGYGIVEESNGKYSFQIESIRDHLLKKERYKKINLSQEEMWAEISERRNKIEPQLRRLCRNQMQAFYGKTKARDEVLQVMGTARAAKNGSLSYEDLFNANRSGIYFEDLRKLISKHWECFKNILGSDKDELIVKLTAINKFRKDAHANDLTQDEMNYFRVCATSIEKKLTDFLE